MGPAEHLQVGRSPQLQGGIPSAVNKACFEANQTHTKGITYILCLCLVQFLPWFCHPVPSQSSFPASRYSLGHSCKHTPVQAQGQQGNSPGPLSASFPPPLPA